MSNRSAAVRIDAFPQDALPAFRRDAITGEERIREVRDGDEQGANQAMMLQRELAQAIALGAFDPREAAYGKKWSPRRTLAFMFVTCGAFWCAVGYAIMKLF
jgi:hypothetical protein